MKQQPLRWGEGGVGGKPGLISSTIKVWTGMIPGMNYPTRLIRKFLLCKTHVYTRLELYDSQGEKTGILVHISHSGHIELDWQTGPFFLASKTKDH